MVYALFNNNGFPLGFYLEGMNIIPDGAIAITAEQWAEFLDNQGRRRWEKGEVVKYSPPAEEIIILYPTDLWRRMTDEEVSAVESVMSDQPARIQRIFNSATEYRSDDELWPMLVEIATSLFGKERADQILSPSA